MQAIHTEPTKRELEVAARLCAGYTDKEIAKDIHISPDTVKYHVEKLKRILNAANRQALAFWVGAKDWVTEAEIQKLAALKNLVVLAAIMCGVAQETFWWISYDEEQRKTTPHRIKVTRSNTKTMRAFGRDFNFIQNDIDIC